jgi:fumarate hydratase, class II
MRDKRFGQQMTQTEDVPAIAHDADRTGRTLRESALDSGAISAEDFDRIVNPATMVGPF